jgi:Flp pilus assembly protein TadB
MTLSNGSVLVLPTGSFGGGGSSVTGAQQSSASSTNIPAVIGAVLALLVFLALVIFLFLWRRKQRAQRQLANLDTQLSPIGPVVVRQFKNACTSPDIFSIGSNFQH